MWNVQLEKSIRATTAEQQKMTKTNAKWRNENFIRPISMPSFVQMTLYTGRYQHVVVHRAMSLWCASKFIASVFFLFLLLNSVRRNLFLRFWWEKQTSSLMQAHSIGRQSIMVVNNWRDSPFRHFDDLIISIFHCSVILHYTIYCRRREPGLAHARTFSALCKHRQGWESLNFDSALEKLEKFLN